MPRTKKSSSSSKLAQESKYAKKKVPELKNLLREYGIAIPSGAKKADLIVLLDDWESQNPSPSRGRSSSPKGGRRSPSPKGGRRSPTPMTPRSFAKAVKETKSKKQILEDCYGKYKFSKKDCEDGNKKYKKRGEYEDYVIGLYKGKHGGSSSEVQKLKKQLTAEKEKNAKEQKSLKKAAAEANQAAKKAEKAKKEAEKVTEKAKEVIETLTPLLSQEYKCNKVCDDKRKPYCYTTDGTCKGAVVKPKSGERKDTLYHLIGKNADVDRHIAMFNSKGHSRWPDVGGVESSKPKKPTPPKKVVEVKPKAAPAKKVVEAKPKAAPAKKVSGKAKCSYGSLKGDYNCGPDQYCSATGNCVKTVTAKNYILDVQGRKFLGSKSELEKLQDMLGGVIKDKGGKIIKGAVSERSGGLSPVIAGDTFILEESVSIDIVKPPVGKGRPKKPARTKKPSSSLNCWDNDGPTCPSDKPNCVYNKGCENIIEIGPGQGRLEIGSKTIYGKLDELETLNTLLGGDGEIIRSGVEDVTDSDLDVESGSESELEFEETVDVPRRNILAIEDKYVPKEPESSESEEESITLIEEESFFGEPSGGSETDTEIKKITEVFSKCLSSLSS